MGLYFSKLKPRPTPIPQKPEPIVRTATNDPFINKADVNVGMQGEDYWKKREPEVQQQMATAPKTDFYKEFETRKRNLQEHGSNVAKDSQTGQERYFVDNALNAPIKGKLWDDMSLLEKTMATGEEFSGISKSLVGTAGLGAVSMGLGVAGMAAKTLETVNTLGQINKIQEKFNIDRTTSQVLLDWSNAVSEYKNKEFGTHTYQQEDITIKNLPKLLLNPEFVLNSCSNLVTVGLAANVGGFPALMSIESGGFLTEKRQEALLRGDKAATQKEVLYSLGMGAFNGWLENYSLKVMTGAGKVPIASALIKKISNRMARSVASWGLKVATEMGEEFIQEGLPLLVSEVVFKEKDDIRNAFERAIDSLPEAIRQGEIGAVMAAPGAGILSGMGVMTEQRVMNQQRQVSEAKTKLNVTDEAVLQNQKSQYTRQFQEMKNKLFSEAKQMEDGLGADNFYQDGKMAKSFVESRAFDLGAKITDIFGEKVGSKVESQLKTKTNVKNVQEFFNEAENTIAKNVPAKQKAIVKEVLDGLVEAQLTEKGTLTKEGKKTQETGKTEVTEQSKTEQTKAKQDLKTEQKKLTEAETQAKATAEAADTVRIKDTIPSERMKNLYTEAQKANVAAELGKGMSRVYTQEDLSGLNDTQKAILKIGLTSFAANNNISEGAVVENIQSLGGTPPISAAPVAETQTATIEKTPQTTQAPVEKPTVQKSQTNKLANLDERVISNKTPELISQREAVRQEVEADLKKGADTFVDVKTEKGKASAFTLSVKKLPNLKYGYSITMNTPKASEVVNYVPKFSSAAKAKQKGVQRAIRMIQVARQNGVPQKGLTAIRQSLMKANKSLGKRALPAKKIQKVVKETKKKPSIVKQTATKGATPISEFEKISSNKARTVSKGFKLDQEAVKLIRKYAVRIGEGRTGSRAIGLYKRASQTIRARSLPEISIVAHEIAHHLDMGKTGISEKFIDSTKRGGKMRKLLTNLYEEYYPGGRRDHPLQLRVTEGFATLLQKYAEMPSTIEAKYPELVNAYFKKGGRFYDPIFSEMIKDLRALIGEYQGLSSLDKISSRMANEEMKVDKKAIGLSAKMKAFVADYIYPIEHLMKKVKKHFTKEDLSLWLRMYETTTPNIIANNILGRGAFVKGYTRVKNGTVAKTLDYNWKDLVDRVTNRYDAFGSFLIARRKFYEFEELKLRKEQAAAMKMELLELAEQKNKLELGEEAEILRGTKGMTADDIMKTYPNIQLKKDVPAKDIHGKKVEIPKGEKLTPYKLKGNKILLQDGETYLVSKNQFQNIKGNSKVAEGKPFAPELAGLKETVLSAKYPDREGMSEAQRIEARNDIPYNTLARYSGETTTFPGGKKYREILIKAPVPESKATKELKKIARRQGFYDDVDWNDLTLQDSYGQTGIDRLSDKIFHKVAGEETPDLMAIDQLQKEIIDENKLTFKSPHWDDRNVLASIRMDNRLHKNKKVAFMEELQSDWASEGRKKGFIQDTAKRAKVVDDIKKYPNVPKDEGEWSVKVLEENGVPKSLADKWYEFNIGVKSGGVPSHPFLKNWQEFSVKRALIDAVESKAEYFAWITGEQTTNRYNLSVHVKNVEWDSDVSSRERNEAGVKNVIIYPKESPSFNLLVGKDGTVMSDFKDLKGKKLDEVLGKGLADKIMEKEKGTLSGKGLEFGGEWTKNLYDNQVKNIVEDLTGAKVRKVDIGLPAKPTQEFNLATDNMVTKTLLTKDNLKVGQLVADASRVKWVVTDILSGGKFKAARQVDFIRNQQLMAEGIGRNDNTYYENTLKTTFKIEPVKTAKQPAIRLTPEIKAKIRGEALKIKTSQKKFEEQKDPQAEIDALNIKIKRKARLTEAFIQEEVQPLMDIIKNDQIPEGEAIEAYNEGKDLFKKETEMYDALTREDLEFAADPSVQLINQTEKRRLASNEGYAPFKRQFYDEIIGDAEQIPRQLQVGKNKLSSLMRRKGSSKVILNPLAGAIWNHAEFVKKGMRQIVHNKAAEQTGVLPDVFEEVDLKTYIDENGVTRFPQEKDPNIIMARVNYKRKAILVDAEIKTIFDDVLTHDSIDGFGKLLLSSSRFFSKGTTGLYSQFILANIPLDQISAAAQSNYRYIPIFSATKELHTALSQKESPENFYALEYLRSGGERQTMAGWQNQKPGELFDTIKNEAEGMKKVLRYLDRGGDILGLPSSYSEVGSRMVEYVMARRAGEPMVAALERAGRVTAPFHHVGTWGGSFGQTWVKAIPFYNPAIQVVAQAAETLNKPGGRNKFLTVMAAVGATQLAGLALLLAGGSDEQKRKYIGLQPEALSNYFFVPHPNGKELIKVRFPGQFTPISTAINMLIANRFLNANYETKDFIDGMTSFLPQQLNPGALLSREEFAKLIVGWIPQMIKIPVMTAANKRDYPKIMPLEGYTMEQKLPSERYTDSTSEGAKLLGKVLNWSPVKIDYLLTGFFGRFIGYFTIKPSAYDIRRSYIQTEYYNSSRQIQKYFELKETNDQKYNSYKGDPDKRKEFAEVRRERLKLNQVKNLLSRLEEVDEEKQLVHAETLRNRIFMLINKL